MIRSLGLVALVLLAIAAIVGAVGLTSPVQVEPATHSNAPEPTALAPVSSDAGSLDSLLDTVHLGHQMQHGR